MGFWQYSTQQGECYRNWMNENGDKEVPFFSSVVFIDLLKPSCRGLTAMSRNHNEKTYSIPLCIVPLDSPSLLRSGLFYTFM
jgi:hypothetical protein